MKKNHTIFYLRLTHIFLTISIFTSMIHASSISKSTWLPRSFSSYLEHDLINTQSLYHKTEDKHFPVFHTSFFTQYMHNLNEKNGAQNLGASVFWSGNNTLTIGNHDGRAQLDAYQLGLGNVITNSDGIAGIIQLNPTIQHIGTDMLFQYIHDPADSSFFFKIHAPLGAIKITPHLTTIMQANPDYQTKTTQTTATDGSNPSSDISYLFNAYSIPERRQETIDESLYGGIYTCKAIRGSRAKPIHLSKARISSASQTAIRCGDISASIGYNILANESGNFGIAFKTSCPTGNVPTADYVLEPIFGRAGLWGVGAELSGLYHLWENDRHFQSINIIVQAEILHLISGRRPSYRTFDLKKNGPGSKYMLAQCYKPSTVKINNIYEIETKSLGILTQVANFTTLPVISNIGAEGSAAIMINMQHHNWNASIGAEFWGRTHEQLNLDYVAITESSIPNLNDYAIVGRQVDVYSIDGTSDLEAYYCEPNATINKSQNPVQLVGSDPNLTLPAKLPTGIADARIAANRIPYFMDDALNISGAAAAQVYTIKFFGTCGHTWKKITSHPSLTAQFGIELTNNTNNVLKLWSVGLLGSLAF